MFKIKEKEIYNLAIKPDLSLAGIYPEGENTGSLIVLGSGYYWDLVSRIEKSGYEDKYKVGLWYSKNKSYSTRLKKLNNNFNVVDNIAINIL